MEVDHPPLDPAKPDTDGNGTPDGEEDRQRRLGQLQRNARGTNPYDETDFPGNVPGDVNGSGKVDAVDVQLVINAALAR